MSIISGSAAISTTAAGSPSFYDFPIGQSLMFDGSSYLSDTFGTVSGSYTFSVWLKRTSISGDKNTIISTQVSSSIYPDLAFADSDVLRYYDATANNSSTSIYRDTSAWYHIVMFWNGSDQKVYVNGDTASVVSSTTKFEFSGKPAYIGRSYSATGGEEDYFNGYMAEINFIDGLALTPSSFGETKNGVWIPKNPSGLTYGTSGFRLTFSDSSNPTNDSSNTNHWTANGF
jgi:hypothetical protein